MTERTDLIKDSAKTYHGTEATGTDRHESGLMRHPRRGTWTTGLFECTAHGWAPCADGTFCFDCVAAEMYNKLYNGRGNKIYWPVFACMFISDFLSGVQGCAACGFVSNLFVFTIRRDLRLRYNIHMQDDGEDGGDSTTSSSFHREMFPMCGEFASDLFFSVFCWPCVICQMQREMAARGDYAGYIMFASETQYEISAAASAPTEQRIA